MRNKAALIMVVLIAFTSCRHTEEAKYEEVYFASVAEKVAKAEGIAFTPAPTAVITRGDKAEKPAKTPEPAPVPVSKSAAPAAPGQDATPVKKEKALPEKPKKRKFKIKELDIASDSMTFNNETSVAVFTGNVTLVSEGVKLRCDMLTSRNYKDNADATGNVRAFYREQKTTLRCARVKYGSGMSLIKAFDGVVTEKVLDDGNTITMHADEADFDMRNGSIEAKKKKKKVKVIFKDIVAFCDKVLYNDETGELEMSGKPVLKKSNSSFTAYKIKVDTVKKTMKMENSIWTRLFYGDLKKAEAEVKLETNKDAAPR